MQKKFLAKVAALGLVVGLLCSGCGSGVTVMAMISPSISQVSPQVVTAGTPNVTVTVQGANFQSQASLTVNGTAVPTTVVNSTTLAAKISGSTLAQPAVAQLQVKNTDGTSSNQVPLTVTDAPQSGASLSITTTTLPSGLVGTPYNVTFAATGGTAPYGWTISSGSLPAGLTLSSAGVLSGTPTANGTSTFAITASDSSSPQLTETISFSIAVAPATGGPMGLGISTTTLASAQMGATYSAALSATGGTPGYTWSIASGSLPAGLAMSSAGVISGTPTATGTSTFTVAVKDSGSPAQTVSVQESITVSASGLSVTTTTLAAATDGSSYNATLSASGGTPGYTWSISSGSLPAGLSLSGGGAITGTPAAPGSFTFTVTVKDNGSPAQTNSAQESITVSPAGLSVTTTSLAAAQDGSSYSATLSANGGTPNYAWSIASGSLPAGLSLSGGGAITGTPTATGTSTFTVAVKDSGSPAQLASAQESITVSAAGLSITTTSLATAKDGSSYNATLSASGGTPSYMWSIASGSLPAGLSLSSGGVITGTPTATGSFTFTVAVKDSGSPAETASAQESIAVSAAGLSVTTASLAAATNGSSYNATLSASGGTPNYTWSISSGSLPAGLSLSSAGAITGTPTATGTFAFTVAVKDSGSPAQTAYSQESIAVSAATLSIATTSLAAATNGSPYSATMSASGGTPNYAWSVASGSLPAGLTLSSGGAITGTPTGTGTSTFTVAVKDSGSPAQTASAQESITVSAPGLTVTTTSLAAATNGSSYSATLAATGGTPSYTWTVTSGSLPAGLTMSSAGVITGTPTGTGTSTFKVSVKDSGSPVQKATAQESIAVSAAGLTITTTSLGSAKDGTSYNATLSASGGSPSYTWSVTSGSLPAGLTMSSAGVITGTPTGTGTSTFTVAVKDSGSPVQTTSAQESITASAAGLSVTTTSLAAATNGSSYSATLSASGGSPSYTWSIASGSLPAGLSLSSGGVITGTPTGTGTSTFTVGVKDSGSPVQTASSQEAITVNAAPSALTITSTSLGGAQTGSSYSTTLAAAGGTPSYTWTVTSGTLPAGLSLSSAGVISGTPTTTGNSSFTVTVTDSSSPAQTASAQESISVTLPQLTITTASLSYGTMGSGYSVTLGASGGTLAYTWTVPSGSLPAGLSLSSAGVISGTPTATGTSTFTISVSDSETPAQTATAQESITVDAQTTSTPGSAQIYVYPQTPVAPRGSYQTVTAVVTGVSDKTVTWTTDGGTIVGTNPCVVNEPCTVALYTTSTGTYHLTATSNATHSVSATSTVTITGSPTPATSHPRLGGITAAMLPALRAKAVSSNPLYMAIYNNAVTAYNNDSPIWAWSCSGGSGQPNSDQSENWREQDAYLFAFMSMVDPNDSTYNWGCYGRDIWMYYANFWMNPLSSSYTPSTLAIRQVDANYGLTGNHGADSTEDLTLTADWLMAGNYLSTSDLATTRQYFALAAQQMISIQYTGTEAQVGNYNSPSQFNSGSEWDFGAQRSMGNNYTHSKMLYLVAAALSFNDNTTDDPALTNTCNATRYQVCPDGTAGSLHAYWTYFDGGMLYKDWAHMEDPSVSIPAYTAAYSNISGTPTCEDSTSGTQVPCFGDGRGGESSEGSWYQYSMYRLALAMTSIESAGYNDPMQYGPQMSLATSSWWDLKSVSDLQFLTYTNGSGWGFFSTGDTLYLFREPSDYNAQAWLMVSDSLMGRSDRTAALEWPILATSIGGPSEFISYDLTNAYASVDAIPMFISLPGADPTTNPPADPRLQMPTDLYSAGNQHIIVRSGWDANGPYTPAKGNAGTNTAFSFYCPNTRIDHEHEVCGGFDLLSNGEFITKTRTVFNDYNMMLAIAEHSNEAGYGVAPATPCATSGSCFEWQAALGSDGNGGGEFWHGYQAGSVTLAHAELPGYVAAIVDTTSLYNGSSAVGWGTLSGITAASRSLIYLRGSNQIVYYDRGAGAANSKRVWLTTTGPITVSGQGASWPTRSGSQIAYATSLLPANATVSDAGAYLTNEDGSPGTTDWEPYSHLLIDAGTPASTQFLTVLEWGGSSFTKSNTVLVQSTAGQNFDGALVGGSLVMFMRNWPTTFSSVTYPASGAATQYVSDLTPNTTYSITGAGAPATATTDTAGVLVFTAGGTGNITVATVQ